LKIAITATGSVAEIIAQKSIQTKNGICSHPKAKGSTKYSQVAINKVEINNPQIARENIDLEFFNKSL
jgi:hypothetical protein